VGELVDRQGESGLAGLGRTLRHLREKAGKSLGQLAQETAYDKSYLSRLEAGKRLSKLAVMEDLDRYYGSGDLLVQLWKVARHDAFKDKYKRFMGLEATARVMHLFTPGVPGLVQTEEFARGVLSGAQATPGNGGGELTDDSEEVLRHRLSYDRLRDLALSPSDSLTFIRDVLEEHRS
jgi:hypothetical protein